MIKAMFRLLDAILSGAYAGMLKRGKYVAWLDKLQARTWKMVYHRRVK